MERNFTRYADLIASMLFWKFDKSEKVLTLKELVTKIFTVSFDTHTLMRYLVILDVKSANE